jgi:hypothetical protein
MIRELSGLAADEGSCTCHPENSEAEKTHLAQNKLDFLVKI